MDITIKVKIITQVIDRIASNRDDVICLAVRKVINNLVDTTVQEHLYRTTILEDIFKYKPKELWSATIWYPLTKKGRTKRLRKLKRVLKDYQQLLKQLS